MFNQLHCSQSLRWFVLWFDIAWTKEAIFGLQRPERLLPDSKAIFPDSIWEDCGDRGKSFSCNWWAARSIPIPSTSDLCCCVLGQDTSPASSAADGQRAQQVAPMHGSLSSVRLHQGSCDYYPLACFHQTECSVK